MTETDHAAAALAYAMWDVLHTTRLGEASAEAQADYIRKARNLLTAITDYRTERERMAIAVAILGKTLDEIAAFHIPPQ